MSYTLLSAVVFVIFGFAAMYALYLPRCNEYQNSLQFKYNMLAFPYVFGLYVLGAIGAYFLIGDKDFIENMSFTRMALPLLFAAIIYAASFLFTPLIYNLTVIALIAVTVYLQPLGVGNPFPQVPEWCLRLALIAFFSIYCLEIKIMNILPHTFIIPQCITVSGLLLLGFIGAAPVYITLCAALLLGIMSAYMIINYYNVKIDLDDGACVAITYLISSLILFTLGEFSFVSCTMFTIVFWAELSIAVWNKFMGEKRQNLAENTGYYLAAEKYSLNVLTSGMIKIGIVTLFIAWFQLFSVNLYSLALISYVLTIWLNNTIGKPFKGLLSIKEINKEFVSDLKKGLEETKNIMNKEDKK